MCLDNHTPDKRLPESLRKLATAFAFIWFPVFCLGIATTIIYAQAKQTPGMSKSVADTCPWFSMGILGYTISANIFGSLGMISVLSVLNLYGKSSFFLTDCLMSTSLFLDVSALSQMISLTVRG
jgi:hypothetical protein